MFVNRCASVTTYIACARVGVVDTDVVIAVVVAAPGRVALRVGQNSTRGSLKLVRAWATPI